MNMNMNINEFESLKNYNEDNLSKRLIQAGLWLIIIATSAIVTITMIFKTIKLLY